MSRWLLRLLVAAHPRVWRDRYGAEFGALLDAGPSGPAVILDVARNAVRQHARAHAVALRLVAAVLLSTLVEVVAVRAGLTQNILWLPASPLRAAAVAALLLPWLPVAADLRRAARRRALRHAVVAAR